MEYKYKWYIPDAYLHSRGTGYFTSHEGCAFINETDRDAHVRFTFYFQDREPMTGYTSVVLPPDQACPVRPDGERQG